MDEKIIELEFEASNSTEYEVKTIRDSGVYANKAKSYLPGLYYLVSWKKYPEKENTWKLSSVVQHLKKPINFFHKKHLEKPMATFPLIDSAPPMARLTVKPTRPITKRNWGQPTNSTNKQARNWVLDACDI